MERHQLGHLSTISNSKLSFLKKRSLKDTLNEVKSQLFFLSSLKVALNHEVHRTKISDSYVESYM